MTDCRRNGGLGLKLQKSWEGAAMTELAKALFPLDISATASIGWVTDRRSHGPSRLLEATSASLDDISDSSPARTAGSCRYRQPIVAG